MEHIGIGDTGHGDRAMWTLFEYLYRDAGNFKAFGCVALGGGLTLDEQEILRSHFPGDGLFIAEQLGVPPLYDQLYRWSDGPTPSDHCWHEFRDVKLVADDQVSVSAYRWCSAQQFLDCVAAVERWNEELSPHFRLEAWP